MRSKSNPSLKEKIAHTLPLLKEARKHNNRSLVKELEIAIGKSTNEDTKLYQAVSRETKAFLLQSAYTEKEELSPPLAVNMKFPTGRRSLKTLLNEERES